VNAVGRRLLPIVIAAAFGAADQFLGARAYVVGVWAVDASLLSAPWLLIAFLAGWSQPTLRRAVLLGFACTTAALVGYWAMTLSPIEGATLTLRGVRGLVVGQRGYALGGILTGPVFGWLGYRWRTRRDWISGVAAAAVVCCEPLAHAASATTGYTAAFRAVWAAEVLVGVAMALYFVAATRRRTAR
jgi:hypothetical protein